jgi:hypothetical protein
MLQAGRSSVQVPDEVDFFNLPNSSSCTMALGSNQLLTDMSTRNLPGDKKQPTCRADTLQVPDEVDFFNLPNSSSCTMALGSNQLLTDMSTRNLPGDKKQPTFRADTLAAICEPNVGKCGEPHPLATLRASTACTGITLPYLTALPYLFQTDHS